MMKGTCSTKACKLSTGAWWKKPWIWPQWRSTDNILSTPAASSNIATSEADMGTRAVVLRSCRAYP